MLKKLKLKVLWRPTRPFRTNTQKRCPFLYRGLECKSRSQEIPGVTGKFGLGVQNEAWQRLTEFCQENALVLANTLCPQHKRRLCTWTSPDGQYWSQIDYILCSQRWRSSIESTKTRPGADWIRSWTPYYQMQAQIEESRESHQTIQLYPKSNPLRLYSGSEK